MLKMKTIHSFFKRKERIYDEQNSASDSLSNVQNIIEQLKIQPVTQFVETEIDQVNIDTLMRDPEKHEIRRAYIKFGRYQFIMDEYPLSGLEKYSPEVDVAFCLPCYLFSRKSSPFTSGGFRNWKKVNNGKDCAFLSHSCKDLLNQLCHIDKNAPQNAIYTSPSIQKKILHVFARKVDESKREQIALVVRFVDKHVFVKERLIDVVHICSALSQHNLNIQNVRGQGYDGASNMRREWKELQVLIIQEFATNQIETGRGANQIGTLKRSADTRWISHFNSICSLLRMLGATTSVLEDLATNGSTYSQRGDDTYTLKSLLSFDFVFILHMMKEIMRITDKLCQALQQKSQDILNAMHLVSSTKSLIQQLRDSNWGALLKKVSSFYNDHAIQIPDMSASFSDLIRSRQINGRFSEQATELLILSTSLDPKDAFKLFSVCNIYNLAKNFYSLDFSEHEKIQLDYELQHYELDVVKTLDFQNLSTIAELSTERAFSATKIIKTRLRNKMEDEFLSDYMIVYIEKESASKFTLEMIIDNFSSMKHRRANLKIPKS
ncbi:hypothetical protein AAHE18_10G059500 [Arachis hypogaea]